jgi:carboxyl-terminal processing protease
LTTARYYTPSGRSIQAEGIEPDKVVEEELPADLAKADEAAVSEATLRGHLKRDGVAASQKEEDGSSAYVPAEKDKDTQLQYAIRLLSAIKSADTEAGKPKAN